MAQTHFPLLLSRLLCEISHGSLSGRKAAMEIRVRHMEKYIPALVIELGMREYDVRNAWPRHQEFCVLLHTCHFKLHAFLVCPVISLRYGCLIFKVDIGYVAAVVRHCVSNT